MFAGMDICSCLYCGWGKMILISIKMFVAFILYSMSEYLDLVATPISSVENIYPGIHISTQ